MGGLGATIIPAWPATVEGTSHSDNVRYHLVFRNGQRHVDGQEALSLPPDEHTRSSARGAQTLSDEVFVDNRTGLAVRACDLRLKRCRFGRLDDRASPNSETNIMFTTWSRRGAPPQSGSVTLHDCVLAGPTPVAQINADAEAWVLSTNHDRKPGVRRAWGPVPAGITD